MGLNDIIIPASALAGLYAGTLVETGDVPATQVTPVSIEPAPTATPVSLEPAAAQLTETATWKYLGNNRKKILIVVNYEGKAYLPDEELTFLTKMLTACKLGLDDVAIVNSSHYPAVSSSEYLKEFRSERVFLFGIDPATFGLPLSFPQYQVQSFAGTTFLYSAALEQTHRDELLKSKLWVCLKRIFSL